VATASPTASPTALPTDTPTDSPTSATDAPTAAPTDAPTNNDDDEFYYDEIDDTAMVATKTNADGSTSTTNPDAFGGALYGWEELGWEEQTTLYWEESAAIATLEMIKNIDEIQVRNY
jgi:hypothetical protein